MMLGNLPEVTEPVKDGRVVSAGVVSLHDALALRPVASSYEPQWVTAVQNTSGIVPSGPGDKMGLQDRGGRWRMVRETRSIELGSWPPGELAYV